jgi:hypothetical protein
VTSDPVLRAEGIPSRAEQTGPHGECGVECSESIAGCTPLFGGTSYELRGGPAKILTIKYAVDGREISVHWPADTARVARELAGERVARCAGRTIGGDFWLGPGMQETVFSWRAWRGVWRCGSSMDLFFLKNRRSELGYIDSLSVRTDFPVSRLWRRIRELMFNGSSFFARCAVHFPFAFQVPEFLDEATEQFRR